MHLSCGIQASREPRGSSLKAALLCSPPPVHVLSYLKSGKRQLQAISRLHCLPLPIALLDDVPRDRPRDSGEEGHNLIYFGILRSRNRSSFPSMCFLSYLISAIPSRGGLNLSWASGNAGAKVQTASEESGSTALESVNSKTV